MSGKTPAKSKWSKAIPRSSGWYWVRLRTKHGMSMCPASVDWLRKREWIVRTADNSFICSHTPDHSLRFGPRIEIPKYP